MIDWLQIRHFAIADEVDLEFDSGLTTVTGETGSGKSIIVDAIGLLLGDRADNGFIKHNHPTAELQAGFNLPEAHPALNWLEENNLDNDGECILRRTIRRDKPSRAYVNGQAVTVSQLKQLGKELVDIHGQNEHHSLLQKAVQRSLLDMAADNLTLIDQLGAIYIQLSELDDQIQTLNNESDATVEKRDLLQFQLQELELLNPTVEEWEWLESAQKKAHHTRELTIGTQSAASRLYEDDHNAVFTALNACHHQLDQLSQFDPSLTAICSMIEEAQVNVEEAAKALRVFYEEGQIDQEEIDRIEERFSLYHELSRKHRVQAHELAEQMQSMLTTLEGLKDPDAEIARLQALRGDTFEKYSEIANQISQKRAVSAEALSEQVTHIMAELGMGGGIFKIALTPVEPDQVTRYGLETVEFLVTANPGMPLSPLSKVASGGELSRISLAIQVILAKQARIPTLIFDEVDVGIGGSVADVVGLKLHDLGQSAQVLCITHLSQVAAKGDQQFSVQKGGGDTVSARVSLLDDQQRIEEIARMTSGAKLTQQSLNHAREMLSFNE